MISIILPIRNEFDFISKTLDSIIEQDYPHATLEIIIADGMSDDGTRAIIEKYQENFHNIKIVDNPERIVPTGFNRALSEAKGEIIIRIDGHSAIDKNYIDNCIKLLKYKVADCVGGATKHIAIGKIGQVVNAVQSTMFGVGGVAFRTDVTTGKFVDTLAFGAYNRKVFELIGGYDEELIRNQDDEFNFRLIQNGGKIWLDPSIKSVYYPRNNFKQLFKQYFQYGFYKVRVIQKRGGVASWRHLVPGTFILCLALSLIINLTANIKWLFYLVLGSYCTANLIATSLEAFKQITNPKHRNINYSLISNIALLPVTFLTIHFSYGLSFLIGLVYFWNRWSDRAVRDSHFDREEFIKNSKANRARGIIV